MKRRIGMFTMLVLVLGAGVRAEAQTGERVLDTLNDFLRGTQQVQGYVVAIHDSDFVVRGRDNRTYTISTTGVDRQILARLHPGKPVKVSLKRGTGDSLVATAVEPESGPQRSFRTAVGKVESVSGDRIQFRTAEGFVIPLDLAQIVGPRLTLRQGEQATVTYEVVGQNPLIAVWIEPSGAIGAASPRTSEPGATRGGYERIHGFVESVGLGTLTLKADDGRTMMIDVSNSRGGVGDIRPGDLVNVVGRSSADRFVAELVQKN
jgi:hypothetical protein